MRKKIHVVIAIVAIIIIAIYFQNCGSNHGSQDSASGDNLGLESIVAYEQTLFPLVVQNCSSCHGVNQSPLFALNDSTYSHNVLTGSLLVSLRQPGSSRIVEKIRNGHRNFNSALADSFENEIADWANRIGY